MSNACGERSPDGKWRCSFLPPHGPRHSWEPLTHAVAPSDAEALEQALGMDEPLAPDVLTALAALGWKVVPIDESPLNAYLDYIQDAHDKGHEQAAEALDRDVEQAKSPAPSSAAAATPAERHADIESRLHDGDIIYAEDLRWLLEERNRLLILWAEAAQQERERLTEEAFRLARFEFKSGPIISDVVWLNDILAILAEPSE